MADRQAANALAARARRDELAERWDLAYAGYVEAAQKFLHLARAADAGTARPELREAARVLVVRAEQISKQRKTAIRPVLRDALAPEEQDRVLHESSKINDVLCARWTAADAYPREAASSPPPELAGARWVRASEALPGAIMFDSRCRVTQSNVADCSLVAALVVSLEHHRKFQSKLAFSCLYPQDIHGCPVVSQSGRYAARFFINGDWRCISIDDLLPVSLDGRQMFASTLSGNQLWPALVEKAYIKLMGGYELGGSDSGTDMHILTGWIPEQIHLVGAGFHSDKVWNRVMAGFESGRCVVTAGTGRSSAPHPRLVLQHNYAVLDMSERDGVRRVVLSDPWKAAPAPGSLQMDGLMAALQEREESLEFAWDSISTNFDSLYVNWDPAIFSHTTPVHCSTKVPEVQLRLAVTHASSEDEVWLLLQRHRSAKGDVCHVGIDVTEGLKVEATADLIDSANLLFRFLADASVPSYNLKISFSGKTPAQRITLSAYSLVPVEILPSVKALPYTVEITGKWIDRSAGGNHSLPTYMFNPQYRLTVSAAPGRATVVGGELTITCRTSAEVCSNVRLVRGGDRVDELRESELIAGDSEYRYSTSSLRQASLQPGTYTLIVSNHRAGEEGDFTLVLHCALPMQLGAIKQEGAGLFGRSATGRFDDAERACFVVDVPKSAGVKIRLQSLTNAPLALSLFSPAVDGVPGKLLHSTGALSDAISGVLLDVPLLPAASSYLLHATGSAQTPFQLELYASEPLTLRALT